MGGKHQPGRHGAELFGSARPRSHFPVACGWGGGNTSLADTEPSFSNSCVLRCQADIAPSPRGSAQPGRHGAKLLEIATPWWIPKPGRLGHAREELKLGQEPQLGRQVLANEQLNIGKGCPNFNCSFCAPPLQGQFSDFVTHISLLHADALPACLHVE